MSPTVTIMARTGFLAFAFLIQAFCSLIAVEVPFCDTYVTYHDDDFRVLNGVPIGLEVTVIGAGYLPGHAQFDEPLPALPNSGLGGWSFWGAIELDRSSCHHGKGILGR